MTVPGGRTTRQSKDVGFTCLTFRPRFRLTSLRQGPVSYVSADMGYTIMRHIRRRLLDGLLAEALAPAEDREMDAAE